MTKFVRGRLVQFGYFDRQLGGPDWTGKRVLDFGGNVGSLLDDPDCRIEPANYWCVDVSRDAIEEGQRRYPDAHFVFYDRYNYEYNPTGVTGLPVPDPGVKFDFVLAFSVINNMSRSETLSLVDQLMALLTDDGRLAFSFHDPLWSPLPGSPYHPPEPEFRRAWSGMYRTLERQHGGRLDMDFEEVLARARETAREADAAGWSNLRWGLRQVHVIKPDMDVGALLAQAERTPLTWVALVNGAELVLDPQDEGHPEKDPKDAPGLRVWTHRSFCTAEHMSRLFPNAQIRTPVYADRQHCAIIDAREGTGRSS